MLESAVLRRWIWRMLVIVGAVSALRATVFAPEPLEVRVAEAEGYPWGVLAVRPCCPCCPLCPFLAFLLFSR